MDRVGWYGDGKYRACVYMHGGCSLNLPTQIQECNEMAGGDEDEDEGRWVRSMDGV